VQEHELPQVSAGFMAPAAQVAWQALVPQVTFTPPQG
jgi:hypothetical protein